MNENKFNGILMECMVKTMRMIFQTFLTVNIK